MAARIVNDAWTHRCYLRGLAVGVALTLGRLDLAAGERHGLEDPLMPDFGLCVGFLDGALALHLRSLRVCLFRLAHFPSRSNDTLQIRSEQALTVPATLLQGR